MALSLETIPVEIRLCIIDHLIPAGPIHRAWLPDDILTPNIHIENALTESSNLPPKQPQQSWKHGLLYVNRKINNEYTEELYKRTRFFLYVDKRNVMTEYFWPLLNPKYSGGVHHIRRCTIYFDVTEITGESNFIVALHKTQEQLRAVKELLLKRGFDKLQELRVYINLPKKLSLGVIKPASEQIKAGWLRDMKSLPRLKELWLDLPGYRDEKFKLVGGDWETLPAAVLPYVGETANDVIL